MTAVGITAGISANRRGAKTCTQTCTPLHTGKAVMRAARALWGDKAVTIVTQDTGKSERTVRYWVRGAVVPNLDDGARLLRSDDGLTFLSAIMADSKAAWWRAFKGHIAVTDARRLERAARRRLQEAIDADTDLTAAIARAEALLEGDENFHRNHVDALRSMARVPNSPMAPAGRKGKGR